MRCGRLLGLAAQADPEKHLWTACQIWGHVKGSRNRAAGLDVGCRFCLKARAVTSGRCRVVFRASSASHLTLSCNDGGDVWNGAHGALSDRPASGIGSASGRGGPDRGRCIHPCRKSLARSSGDVVAPRPNCLHADLAPYLPRDSCQLPHTVWGLNPPATHVYDCPPSSPQNSQSLWTPLSAACVAAPTFVHDAM
jgi:hypothetical protein